MTSGVRVRDEIDRQRIELLYAKAPVAFATVVVNGGLLAWFLSDLVPRPVVVVWLAALLVVTVLRVGLHVVHLRHEDRASPELWERAFALGSLLNGLAWGFGGAAFIGGSLPGDVAVVFVVGGMVAGASSSTATSIRSFVLFSGPAVLVVAARLAMSGQRVHIVMSVMLIGFAAAMLLLARQSGRVMATSYRLRFERDELTTKLTQRSRDRAVRLQLLLDQLGVVFLVAELDSHRIVDVSERAEELLGRPASSLVGSRVQSLGRIELFSNSASYNAFVRDAERGSTTVTAKYWDDGVRHTVEIAGTTKQMHGTRYLLIVLEDVTGQRALQSQLARTSLLASIGTLSAGVAHEVNNPLSFVLSNLEFIEEELHDTPVWTERSDLQESITDALDGARRIRRIVVDLMKTARSNEEDDEVADVAAVIDSCMKVADGELRHRAQVVRQGLDEPLHVRGDTLRLSQVFLNLLLNAARAIEAGHANENVVTVTALPGAFVQVEIRDTGGGIASADLPRIFEPFFTTRPSREGSGLGLSICHTLVTDLGGTIEARSVEGEGSAFVVRLPRADATMTPVEPTPPPLEVAANYRVLIVEDDPQVARGIARLLSEWDVCVETDGAAARQRITTDAAFDAVLCDVMMPQLDGMDLYEAVTAIEPHLAGRFVFMTGGALTERTRHFVESSGHVTLTKPMDGARLRRVIDRVARRRECLAVVRS